MIDRRAFIGTLAGGLLAAPLAAGAQQVGKVYRVGVIVPVEPESPTEPNLAAFRQALHGLGYTEGQNIAVEYRYAHGQAGLYAEYAAEFVHLKVDIMVVGSWQPALAAKKVTQTIPIVGVAMGSDPVRFGVVASLARPGSNITGSSWLTGSEFSGKWLDLLKNAAPSIARIGYLTDTTAPATTTSVEQLRATARPLGLTIAMLQVQTIDEVDDRLTEFSKTRGGALIVPGALLLASNAGQIARLAAKHHLPAIYGSRFFTDVGGLMSYGPSIADLWRRAAIYVDRILKGANPGDLPVELPTKFDMVINMKTAKALGLTIPPALLQRADQVIDP